MCVCIKMEKNEKKDERIIFKEYGKKRKTNLWKNYEIGGHIVLWSAAEFQKGDGKKRKEKKRNL